MFPARRAVLSLSVLLLLPPPVLPGEDTERTAAAMAGDLAELADFCRRKSLRAEARSLAEEALALVPDHRRAKRILEKLGEAEDTGSEASREEYERRRAKKAPGLGEGYLALARAAPDAEAAAARAARALVHDPERAAPAIARLAAEAAAGGDWSRASGLLSALPEASWTEETRALRTRAELALSATEPVLRTARGHPMKYWLSAPRQWRPGGSWPVLVTADGAGRNWKGSCLRFMRERDRLDLPFVVVSIVRLNPEDYGEELYAASRRAASVEDWFDLKGVRTVVDELSEELSAERRFYMTGFSAGGAVTWYATIYHPEWLAASAPACGGFGLRSAPGERLVTEAPEREALPIRVFIGVDDKLALGPLAGEAAAIERHFEPYADSFARQGFGNVRLVLLPGVGHSPCAREVTEFFAKVREPAADPGGSKDR